MKKLFLPGALLWLATSMRLDLDDLNGGKTPQVDDEGTVVEQTDLINLVIPAGQGQCSVLFDSKSKQDAHFLDPSEHRVLDIYEERKTFLYNWYRRLFSNHNAYQRHLPYAMQHPNYWFPTWDDDKIKYKVRIQVFSDDQTELHSHYRGLPARRMYAFIVGVAERRVEGERLEQAHDACKKKTEIRYQFILDLWLTGDDHTKWPLTNLAMGDTEAISHPKSSVNARKGEWSLEGNVLKSLKHEKSGASTRAAYWILDVTYVDKQDYLIGNSYKHLKSVEKLDKNKFLPKTFWHLITTHFGILDDNRKQILEAEPEHGGLWLITKFPKRRAHHWAILQREYEDDSLLIHENTDLVYFNGKKEEKESPFNYQVAPFQVRNEPKTYQDRGRVGSDTLGSVWTWGDDDHVIGMVLPVVACGLFPKTFDDKPCIRGKKEGEGQ